MSGQNSAIYNSNTQKIVEPQLSTRNAPNHSHFVAGINEHSVQAPLRDLPITNNLQKSGDLVHCKVDRQNSFALYGNKRGGTTSFGQKLVTQQTVQINGIKPRGIEGGNIHQTNNVSTTGEGFNAREPNETSLMKTRPSTSIRLASKSHVFGSTSQNFASGNSQTLKFTQANRQVFNNRTVEATNGGQVQMKSSLGGQGHAPAQ